MNNVNQLGKPRTVYKEVVRELKRKAMLKNILLTDLMYRKYFHGLTPHKPLVAYLRDI